MPEQTTWKEATPDLEDAVYVREAMNGMQIATTMTDIEYVAAQAVRIYRERAAKRAAKGPPDFEVRVGGTCVVCANCQAKDAEIAKLKEQLADQEREYDALVTKLAEAQAKAIQPGDIVFRHGDVVQRVKRGDHYLDADGLVRAWVSDIKSGGEYKTLARVQ